MHVFIVFLFISLIILLFCLYKLGKDDIVFIRKNVPLEQLFNIALVAVIVGLFTSRLLYVAENPARGFLNPLVFLLFPYFPGLSLVGGVIGGLLYIMYIANRKKLPTLRILDFFSIAIFFAIPFGYIGSLFLRPNFDLLEVVFLPLLYIILSIILVKVFLPKLVQNSLRQGSIAALSISLFSLISFLSSMLKEKQGIVYFIDISEIVAAIVFFIALGFLLRQELRQ